jgi:sugar/nucleoside kinase (ribokinase family)
VHKQEWCDAAKILSRADAVVLSEDDVVGGEETIADYARLARLLVVTRGADGADLYLDGQRQRFPSFPAHVIDPTGAGDVFAAAFFVRLFRSKDPEDAMRFANCAASFAVGAVGLDGVPTERQITDRLRGIQ